MATGHDANVSPSEGFVPSSRPITADEFFAFPSEGKRFELVAGEVTEMAVGVPTQRGTQAALVRDAPGSRRRMYRGQCARHLDRRQRQNRRAYAVTFRGALRLRTVDQSPFPRRGPENVRQIRLRPHQ